MQLVRLKQSGSEGDAAEDDYSATHHVADRSHHSSPSDHQHAGNEGQTDSSARVGIASSLWNMVKYKPEVYAAIQRIKGIPTKKSRIAILCK